MCAVDVVYLPVFRVKAGAADTSFCLLHKLCCSWSLPDIQVLMGSLVYLRQGIENSPYVHLLDANQWADICDIFTRDACALLGLSVESPLSVRYAAFLLLLRPGTLWFGSYFLLRTKEVAFKQSHLACIKYKVSAKIDNQRFLCAGLHPAPLQLKRKHSWMKFIFHSLDISAKDEDGNQPFPQQMCDNCPCCLTEK